MKTMHCDYNPNDSKYYCSTKTHFGIVHPDKCELILSHEELFNYIKLNRNKYVYTLPIMVANDFEKRLGVDKIDKN